MDGWITVLYFVLDRIADIIFKCVIYTTHLNGMIIASAVVGDDRCDDRCCDSFAMNFMYKF